MSLLAIAALALQTAQAQDAPVPAPVDGRVTVIQRAEDERERPPINSRIARRDDSGFASDPVAGMLMREWADCIVRIHRGRSLALLATPLNSPEQSALIDQLTGHRFTRRTICARFRSMSIDNLVLRGAIAEALFRWEGRRRRPAGPLAAAPLPLDASARPAVLAQMGRCVVERDPDGAGRVMATRPGTRSSRRAVAALAEQIDGCLPSGLRASGIHPLALRGALGEPYYHRRRSQGRTPDAAPTPPAS
jgi:hypothetical protein